MLLEGKNAVICGAGGAIDGGVASTFAREGARVSIPGGKCLCGFGRGSEGATSVLMSGYLGGERRRDG
jgi:S-adenosylhomocysteine hydrolase